MAQDGKGPAAAVLPPAETADRGLESLPLAPFLLSLSGLGIRPNLADHRRIQLLLHSRTRWTRPRLRDALAALLTGERNQQERFLRTFDRWFGLPPGTTEEESELEPLVLERALEELRQLLDRPPPPIPDIDTDPGRKEPTQKSPDGPVRNPPALRLWALLSLLLAVTVAAILYHWPDPVPRLCLPTTALEFGDHPPEQEASRELELQNCGDAPLAVTRTELDHEAFRLDPGVTATPIAPGTSLRIPIYFRPIAVGEHGAELVLHHTGPARRHSVTLRGQGANPPEPKPEPERPAPPRNRLYQGVPRVTGVVFTPAPASRFWQQPVLVMSALALVLLWYGRRLLKRLRVVEDRAAPCNPKKPERFRLGQVGGEPGPRLDDALAAEIAEAMGHFQSELPSRRLDTTATIRATLANHGIPSLVFRRSKRVRGLLILEDLEAEARAWNPIAGELASRLPAHGIPVLHGRYQGSPLHFRGEDGSRQALEELEEQRDGLLLLLFTDGKGLPSGQRRRTLEVLAHWPRVAWMELREPRAWDAFASLPTAAGIPLYPATGQGVLAAVQHYLGEGRAAAAPARFPPPRNLPLAAALERHLGSALDWARECALLHPLLTPGLAEALRRRFHPDLPPEAVERLHTLPGSQRTAAGLRLADPVRRLLRQGLMETRDVKERAEVLSFILEQIDRARPAGDDDSLAVLAWELAREKVRFELEPDGDCRRLAELEKTPALGPAVGDWLKDFREAGIPFLAEPRSDAARQRLARFRDNPLGLERRRFLPAGVGQYGLLALLLGGLLWSGFWLARLWQAQPEPAAEWAWAGEVPAADVLAWYERREEGEWVPDRAPVAAAEALNGRPVLGGDYRFHMLSGSGHGVSTSQGVDQPGSYRVQWATGDRELPCREAIEGLALEIQRCPLGGDTGPVQLAGWRAHLAEALSSSPGAKPAGSHRQLSLGLEIGAENSPGRRQLRDRLLETGSLDRVYRIPSNAPERIDEALAWMEKGLAGLGGRVQLLAWIPAHLTRPVLPETARTLLIAENTDRLHRLWALLAPDPEPLLPEDRILASMGRDGTEALGKGDPLTLVRPKIGLGQLLVHTKPVEAELALYREPRERQEARSTSGRDQDTTRQGRSPTGILTPGPQPPVDGSADRTGRSGSPLELPAGLWTVVASAKGFRSETKTVAIRTDERHRMVISLQRDKPEPARVTVRVEPKKALLVVAPAESPDTAFMTGTDGDTFILGPGDWIIRAKGSRSDQRVEQRLSLKPGERREIRLTLPTEPVPTYSLTVRPVPANARVRILNIRPRYRDGIPLAAGRYDIEVSAVDYQDWRNWIDLKGDRVLDVTLQPVLPRLLVTSEPAGARLTLERLEDGQTLEWRAGTPRVLQPGQWRVTAKAKGLAPGIRTLTLKPGEEQKLHLVLKRSTGESLPVDGAGFELVHSWQGHSGAICWLTNCLAFSPDGRLLASGGEDKKVKLWATNDGRLVQTLEGHADRVNAVAFSPDGRLLASGSWNEPVRIWSVPSGVLLRAIAVGSDGVNAIAFSPDGQWLGAEISRSSVIGLWNTSDWTLQRTLKGHAGSVNTLAFSPNGQLLASGSDDNTARLWAIPAGELLHTIKASSDVFTIAFSSNGKILAASEPLNTVTLLILPDGSTLHTLQMNHGWGTALAIHPDGRLLAWGNGDGTIDLLRLHYGEQIQTLTGHGTSVRSLAFSPDGRTLASADYKGVIKLWRRP